MYGEKWAKFLDAGDPPAAAQMRLDHAGGGEGGDAGKLKVTPAVLRKRAGNTETVRGQFLKADDQVMHDTGAVPGTLHGFATDGALKTFQTRWQDQVAYVRDEFTRTAKALRTAANDFHAEDLRQAQSLGGGKHR